jgi:excisionase family DNA binding protein
MTAVLEHTVLPPTGKESSLAGIVSMLEHSGQATLVSADGARIEIPAEIQELLREIVAEMAEGKAVTIAPRDTVLTTQQAADLLGISRPTLVRLLEARKIPFTQPGRHRRVALADLIAYQEGTRAARGEILDAMTAEAAEDDSYAQINGFIRTR